MTTSVKLKPHVSQTGDGPALVLLHGWGLHGGIWHTLLPKLEQSFSVYNVDLPGFGYSPVHNAAYSLDYLVDSVAAVIPDQAIVLGWSLGGLVATKLAIAHPGKVKQLITVASNPCFVASSDWPGMEAQLLESFIGYLEEDYEGTLIRFLGIQTMGSATQKEELKALKDMVFIHGQPSSKALRGGLQILHDVDLTSALEQITQPLLRVYGRLDKLVPLGIAKKIDQMHPQSKSIVYRRSAHAPFLSEADQFTEDLMAFIHDSPNLSEAAQ